MENVITKEVVEEYESLIEILKSAKDYSTTDIHQIFTDVETLVSTQAYLIDPLSRLEFAYRVQIVENMKEGDSHAKAEAKARASEAYRMWKKMEMAYNLADEQIRVAKKFESRLESEYKRT